jgi:DNA-binding response OmpR family regulator
MGAGEEGLRRRVLCVDDDALFGGQLTRWLDSQGFQCSLARTATEGLVAVAKETFAAALLDWNLPGPLSGFELCREFRNLKIPVAIIMLSGRTEAEDRVQALNAGADDFVVKPFDPEELCARIRAVLRRCESPRTAQTTDRLCYGPFEYHPIEGLIVVAGSEKRLTPRQTRLIARLIHAAGNVVPNEDIWKDFGVARPPDLANIRMHVYALRRQLKHYGAWIKTIPGRGYALGS